LVAANRELHTLSGCLRGLWQVCTPACATNDCLLIVQLPRNIGMLHELRPELCFCLPASTAPAPMPLVGQATRGSNALLVLLHAERSSSSCALALRMCAPVSTHFDSHELCSFEMARQFWESANYARDAENGRCFVVVVPISTTPPRMLPVLAGKHQFILMLPAVFAPQSQLFCAPDWCRWTELTSNMVAPPKLHAVGTTLGGAALWHCLAIDMPLGIASGAVVLALTPSGAAITFRVPRRAPLSRTLHVLTF